MAKVLITTIPFGDKNSLPFELLENAGIEYLINPFNKKITEDQLAEIITDFDAIIALGAVIRGTTAHFEHVAGACTRGLASVATDTGVPVIFGVLTTDTIEQAVERAGTKAGNKGAEAGATAIEMINLLRAL